MKDKKNNNFEHEGELSLSLIDEFSEYTETALKEAGLPSADIMRFRLSLEDAMYSWVSGLGEGLPCKFSVRRRFRRTAIAIAVDGAKCDPRDIDKSEFGELANSSLLESLGLTLNYSYENGINRILIMPPAGMIQQLLPILAALALGITSALLLKHFFPVQAGTLCNTYVQPLFDALMNLLRTIASPLIFLAVMSGIYGIGDISTLGKIGKKLISRFFFMTYGSLIIALAMLLCFVRVGMGSYSAGNNAVNSIIELVLQIIPENMVSPFLDGNMLQVIFLAVACGLAILILGNLVSSLVRIIDQIYCVVQLLMESLVRLIPLLIFISVFVFMLSGASTDIMSLLLPFAVITVTFLIMTIGYSICISSKYKIGILDLLKKLLPTFIISITTASSTAAFSVNLDTCDKELGIPSNLSRFGVPLGQVIYKPFVAVEYLALSMILANTFNVQLSVTWVITAALVTGILAIATPPIPGGSISIFTVLFLQLNIPGEALALAISIDLLLDYIVTATNQVCLLEDMVLSAGKLGYLDRKILQK